MAILVSRFHFGSPAPNSLGHLRLTKSYSRLHPRRMERDSSVQVLDVLDDRSNRSPSRKSSGTLAWTDSLGSNFRLCSLSSGERTCDLPDRFGSSFNFDCFHGYPRKRTLF